MKCPNCGFEANGKFCENCGSPLAQNSSRKNTEGVNSFEQDNHNAVPEQPRYDYSTENRTCGQSYPNNQQYGQQSHGGFGQNQNCAGGGQQFSSAPNSKKNRRYNNKRYQRYNYTYNSCHSYFDLQFTAKVYGYGE